MSNLTAESVILGILLSVCIGFGVIAAGNMAYQDEIEQQMSYCTSVESGESPDYKMSFLDQCSDQDMEHLRSEISRMRGEE